MPDVGSLTRLSSLLIGLYSGLGDARGLAERSGLNPGNIDLSGPPRVYVWNIIKEASHTGRLGRLITVALEDYPGHPGLTDAQNDRYDLLPTPVTAPTLNADQWQPRLGFAQAEKIMGATSTFLPISFLAVGMERSRSVARVLLPDLSMGTGFLVDGNLLVTNNHVLPDKAHARSARIQFNFQESSSGEPETVSAFSLDPDDVFVTSPMDGGHDFTIVSVVGTAVDQWGALPLSDAGTIVGSPVFIVQHPEGGFKKVALYNNLVTYVDDDVLQYYTDTLPGSSGSPVFDHTWRVVGLHHAGGDMVEPSSGRRVFRNAGINIRRVAEVLQEVRAP
jgi:V8-like Glu-specific endopeptidase